MRATQLATLRAIQAGADTVPVLAPQSPRVLGADSSGMLTDERNGMHWKAMMERDYLYAFDLQGKDVTLTIDKVTGGTLVGTGGKKTKKPLCFFREGQSGKPLALNATNCKTIAALYGNDTDAWTGKRITIYPTTTQFGGDEVECIRVRPKVPPERGQRAAAPPPPEPTGDPEPREPGSDG